MLGFYNYTVYLTYIGLVSAVTGMFLAMDGRPIAAVICLLISGVCDMFDGKIARTKKDRTTEEKRFGIQIDSLCDVCCFGVLPAVIGFSVGADRWWQIAVAALFVVCGVIRLAYYNVTEEIRQDSTDKNREHYQGMPITTSAILVPLLMCFSKAAGSAFSCFYTALLAVMGICFILPVQVKKPGKAGGVIMLLIGVCVFAFLMLKL